MKNDYVLYILMRTDLPSMRYGRAAAQASHAANTFINEWGCGNLNRRDVKEWQHQTTQGFGTAIVLGMTKPQIDKVLKSRIIPQGWVYDPDYVISVSSELKPFLNRKKIKVIDIEGESNRILLSRGEFTCAYIFGKKEELKPLLGEFPLYG